MCSTPASLGRSRTGRLGIVEDVLSGKSANWVVVPEGNGKTTLMSGIALFHLDDEGWGSSSRSSSWPRRPESRPSGFTFRPRAWSTRRPGFKDRFRCLPGHRRINRGLGKTQHNPRMQVFAADDRTADGAIFTLGIIDELPQPPRPAPLSPLARQTSQARRPAGHDLDRRRARIGVRGRAHGDHPQRQADHQRSPHPRRGGRADPQRLGGAGSKAGQGSEVVAEANPASWVTPEILQRKRDDSTMTPEHWLRFTCDIPTRIEGSGILPEDWERCYEPNLDRRPRRSSAGRDRPRLRPRHDRAHGRGLGGP